MMNGITALLLSLSALASNPWIASGAEQSSAAGAVQEATRASSTLETVTRSFLRGQQAELQKNFVVAAQAYREVVSASPEYIEARYRLAQALRKVDPESREAVEQLRFCVEHAPEGPAQIGYRMELASILASAGQSMNAIKELEIVQQQLPNDPRIPYQIAELYWKEKDYSRAATVLDNLIRRYPNLGEPKLLRANIYNQEGRYKEAVALLNETLRAYPNNPNALLERSKASLALGDATSALTDLDTALKINPLNADGYRQVAQARTLQGDREGSKQALSIADTVAKIPPQQAQAFLALYSRERKTPAENIELGSQLAAYGRKDLALSFLEEGLKRNPGDRSAWHLLGMLRYENRDWAGAVEAFKASGQYIRGRGTDYYRYMGTALLNSGNVVEAEKCINEGLKKAPNDRALLECKAQIEKSRQPVKMPTLTSIERNRLEDLEKKRRWLEEKEKRR
ncbi:MAG TPA: tetratricopeptide repeat protein [bacterium]|nr:tetratricopeptide repeat protein [bacterium]HQL61223.1 tetratricopeptide repeat protein [bacterium]